MALTPTLGNLPEAQTTGKYTEQVGIERGEISKKVITALAGFALSMQVGAKDQNQIPVKPDLTKLDTTSTLTTKGAPQIADSGGSASDAGGGLSGISVAGASQGPEDGLFDDMPVLESDNNPYKSAEITEQNYSYFKEDLKEGLGDKAEKYIGEFDLIASEELRIKILQYYAFGLTKSDNNMKLAIYLIRYGQSIEKIDGRAEFFANKAYEISKYLDFLVERGKRADDYGRAKLEEIRERGREIDERGRQLDRIGDQLDKVREQLDSLIQKLG